MTTWMVLLGTSVCTYLLRISMIVAFAGRQLPEAVEERLRLVGPAALAAIIASALVHSGGTGPPPAAWTVLGAPVGHLLAIIVALTVVCRTGRGAHALVAGLPIVWLTTVAG